MEIFEVFMYLGISLSLTYSLWMTSLFFVMDLDVVLKNYVRVWICFIEQQVWS